MRLKVLRQPEPPIIECIWLNTNDNIEYIKENGEWVPLHDYHGHFRHHVDHIIIEDNNSSSSPSDLNMNEIKILINDKISKTEAESLFQQKGDYVLRSELDDISFPEMPDMSVYAKKEDIKDFIKYVPQTLDDNQKAQARTNIGAGTGNGTVTSVSVKMNGTTKGTVTSSGTIDLGTVLTSYTETDPIFKASAAYGITTADIANWNGKTSNTGTVTSVAVKMNGTTKGTVTSSGEIDLGTVLTEHQSLNDYATKAWVIDQGYSEGGDYLKTDGSNGTYQTTNNLFSKLPTIDSQDNIDKDYRIVFLNNGTTYNVSARWFFGANLTATEFSDEDDNYDAFHAPSQKLFVDTINSLRKTAILLQLKGSVSSPNFEIKKSFGSIDFNLTGDRVEQNFGDLWLNIPILDNAENPKEAYEEFFHTHRIECCLSYLHSNGWHVQKNDLISEIKLQYKGSSSNRRYWINILLDTTGIPNYNSTYLTVTFENLF